MTPIISRIEAASGGDRELDALIWYAAVERPQPGDKLDRDIIGKWPAYTSSIDAAMTLVPVGWFTRNAVESQCSNRWSWWLQCKSRETFSRAATPALALCAAALKARSA